MSPWCSFTVAMNDFSCSTVKGTLFGKSKVLKDNYKPLFLLKHQKKLTTAYRRILE